MGANMVPAAAPRRCTRWARSTTTPTCSRTPASRRSCSTRRPSASGPPPCSERVPGLKRLLALGPTEVGEDLLAAAARLRPAPLAPRRIDSEDVAGLAYTGGTTGKPKGVMGTYRSGAAMTRSRWPSGSGPRRSASSSARRSATPAPRSSSRRCCGAARSSCSPASTPALVLEAIEKHRITATMLVPTMLYVLLDHPKFAEPDLSSLETVYYGAAAMSPTRLKEAIDRLGPIFFQFYGQAECPDDHHRAAQGGPRPRRPRTACHRAGGRCRGCTWPCSTTTATRCRTGEPGEICVRGPLVMKGYWNKPEQTAEAFEGRLAAHRRRRPGRRRGVPRPSSTARRT